MKNFCVDEITPDDSLRAYNGVLHFDALTVTSDARLAAEQILQRAKKDAELLLQNAQDEADQMKQQAEQQVLQRADQLLQTLEHANETFLLRAQDIVIDLAQALFNQLVMQMTPREQFEAALKRILDEAPPKLVSPILRVHPDDVEQVPEVEWEVHPDPKLSRGVCRLEASHGEWCVDFSAAVAALKSALVRNRQNLPASVGSVDQDQTDSEAISASEI